MCWRSWSLTRLWNTRPSTTASTATASKAWTCPSRWPLTSLSPGVWQVVDHPGSQPFVLFHCTGKFPECIVTSWKHLRSLNGCLREFPLKMIKQEQAASAGRATTKSCCQLKEIISSEKLFGYKQTTSWSHDLNVTTAKWLATQLLSRL